MQDYRLPRTGKPPLAFQGELIVSQSFVEESPCYLDAEGHVRFGRATWTWTVALYRSCDGRFVYHDHTAMAPPIQPEQHAARFETAKEHRDSLAQMETLRRCPAFVAGPLSLGASGGPL
uniref:Uncharacterized protein n=1 Tax=Desulfovibrio sp. U5L TaxID=596152 RepID=I2PWM5_9BACT